MHSLAKHLFVIVTAWPAAASAADDTSLDRCLRAKEIGRAEGNLLFDSVLEGAVTCTKLKADPDHYWAAAQTVLNSLWDTHHFPLIVGLEDQDICRTVGQNAGLESSNAITKERCLR